MPDDTEYRHICGWCGGDAGPAKIPDSHGICKPCMRVHFPEIAAEMERRDHAPGQN